MSMPTGAARGPVATDVCCFCGEAVEHATEERLRMTVLWVEDGVEGEQSWAAHRACLSDRLHERVKGTGPFFGE
ncbi:MAG TPA: hypothetical protein VH063_08850 [Gaiellaceae bacterium]|jgi:hypothetical protein|nr:hypothetical protein [Gaiellaceae bacterium]